MAETDATSTDIVVYYEADDEHEAFSLPEPTLVFMLSNVANHKVRVDASMAVRL